MGVKSSSHVSVPRQLSKVLINASPMGTLVFSGEFVCNTGKVIVFDDSFAFPWGEVSHLSIVA
jgi:hypothetical protein